MAIIKLLIGAAVDPSVQASFGQVEARAQKANAAMRSASGRTSKQVGQDATGAANKQAAAAERAAAAHVKALDRANAAIARAEAKGAADGERRRQAGVKADQRAFDQRIKASAKAAAAEERDIMRVAAAAEKANRPRPGGGGGDRPRPFARELGQRSLSNVGQVARFGMGMAGQIGRGFGMQADVGSLVQREVGFQETATRTTLSAAAGKGETATPADVKATMAAIRDAGDASGQSFGSLAAGLEEFVSRTSDLKTGQKILADLGKTAKATGSDVAELVAAAGDVAKSFDENDPQRAEKTLAVMRMIAKQGAQGNVEVKDLASYGGRLTATAGLYKGDLSENIGKVGMLAQFAMRGGATDAAEATNSANAFARDITKGAALKRFEGAGINVFADAGRTKINSPDQIIKASLHQTGGDLGQLANLFKNDVSMRPVRAAAKIYNEAGGGEKGMAAVDAEMKKFASTMTEAQVAASFATAQSTAAAQAQEMQNRLDRITAQTMERLVPSLEKLAPVAVQVAEGFAKLVEGTIENPAAAITAVLVGSIMKAGIGAAVQAAIVKSIGGGGAPGVAGAGGAVVPVVAAAVVGLIAGAAIGESEDAAAQKADINARGRQAGIANSAHALRMSALERASGVPTVGDMGVSASQDPLEAMIARRAPGAIRAKQIGGLATAQMELAGQRIQDGKGDPRSEYQKGVGAKYEDAILSQVGKGLSWATSGSVGQGWGRSFDETEELNSRADHKGGAGLELAKLAAEIATMSAKLGGTLNVNVTNQPAPGVDASGRMPGPWAP